MYFIPINLLEIPYPKVFLVADNESEIRFPKFKMADPIWLSLYLKNVATHEATQSDDLKNLNPGYFEMLTMKMRLACT